MKKTLAFLLLAFICLLSFGAFAQVDTLIIPAPDPDNLPSTGDLRKFLGQIFDVEMIGFIAANVTTNITMALTNRFKVWFSTHDKETRYINWGVNAAVAGLLFLFTGKLHTLYQVGIYIVTVIASAIRDKGKYDTLVRTSAKATEPRFN